ncbi:MAG: ABC transporter ATP-binding protein [Clostridia bacterium]|nr:ABC transporter ATP-binding protein [Clostridia bacterium]
MLESKDLVKNYGSKSAVNHVSLTLQPGHIYAILGPNGSGKTTWMKMVTGLVRPTSGTILFEGSPIGIDSRRHIAYMSTEPYFYTFLSIHDVGQYYADFFEDFSMTRYADLMQQMDLDLKLKVKTLSSGMMAKLKVGVTLARDARLYLLDEPFNGIDLLARDAIRKTILEAAQPEKALLLSSHLVEEMESIADTAIFLSEGKLIEMRDLEEMRTQDGISMTERYREIYGKTED